MGAEAPFGVSRRSAGFTVRSELPNQRMQPTGRRGGTFRSRTDRRWRSVERRLVRAEP